MGERWERAERSAWAEFGRQHWRGIVAASVVRRLVVPVLVLAGLAGLGALGWWLWRAAQHAHVPAAHMPAGFGWWLVYAAGAVVLVVLVVLAVRVLRAGRLRARWSMARLRVGRRSW